MKKCPYCLEEIKEDDLKCEHCNEELSHTCPYCAEEIKEGALKCKHCNEWLEDGSDNKVNEEDIEEENDWVEEAPWKYQLSYGIIKGVFLFLWYAWLITQGFVIAAKSFWPKTFFWLDWFVNPITFIPEFIKGFFS